MKDDFITAEDLNLFTSGSRLQIATVFLKENRRNDLATFDLFVRELPPERNYLVFAGLDRVLEYLKNLRLTSKQLAWLQKTGMPKQTLEYFKKFRFTGEVSAMKEGTIFFANEPIMRITAPIIEAQIVEWCLVNLIYADTIIASKFSRFIEAAHGKQVVFGYNRSYGPDTAMRAVRLDQIFGISTSLALYFYKKDLPIAFSAGSFHYLIMAFSQERKAFEAYLKHLRGKGYLLIDTYNSERGIRNFIKAAKEAEAKYQIKVTGIQLDSGDMLKLSRLARKLCDENGLRHAKIFAMSNLNEKKVAKLVKARAPIDVYAGTTELMTPPDAPTLELVYKLSELEQGGKREPKMKLASDKLSLPGRKEVFRVEKDGVYVKDVIGLAGEKVKGQKLLVPMIRQGKLIYKNPTLQETGNFYRKEKRKFQPKLLDVERSYHYSVRISPGLKKLVQKTKREIAKAHHSVDPMIV